MRNVKVILLGYFILCTIPVTGQVLLCDEIESYHPIDEKIIILRDSLLLADIDTIMIYRHWISPNRFNGYGIVLWIDNGVVKQYLIDYNDKLNFCMPPSFSIPAHDTIFSFYFENRLDTIHAFYSNVQPPRVTHWSVHFVDITFNNNSHCFNINGILVDANPENFIAMLIGKLRGDVGPRYQIENIRIRE